MADGAQHEARRPGDDVIGSEDHVEENVPLESSSSVVSISLQSSLTAADQGRKRNSTATSKDRGPASADHASEQPGSLPQSSAYLSPQLQLRPQSLPRSVDSHPLSPPSLVRSRSISFSSPPPAQMERRRSRHASEHEAGSSADETVPIIGREQGDRMNYQSISPSMTVRAGGVDSSNNGSVVESIGQARAREREQRREAQQAAVEAEAREHKWWRKVVEKYGSVELENKGAVARDHLALGRALFLISSTSSDPIFRLSPPRFHQLIQFWFINSSKYAFPLSTALNWAVGILADFPTHPQNAPSWPGSAPRSPSPASASR